MARNSRKTPYLGDNERAQTKHLYESGWTPRQIALRLGVKDARAVNGYINLILGYKHAKFDEAGYPKAVGVETYEEWSVGTPAPLPDIAPPEPAAEPALEQKSDPVVPPPNEGEQRMPPPPLSPPRPVAPLVQPQRLQTQEFAWKPYSGSTTGIRWDNAAVKINVERLNPPDGLLGSHPTDISADEVGRRYGAGLYRLIRIEPGKQPTADEITISHAYGSPRFPNRADSIRTDRVDSAQVIHGPRPAFMNQPPQGRPSSDLKDMVDAATALADRMTPKASDGNAVVDLAKEFKTAVNQGNGSDFLQRWSLEQEKRRADERKDLEERIARERTEDRAREDRLRDDEKRRFEDTLRAEREREDRRRADQDLAHTRELDRIKAEAESREKLESQRHKQMMELEEKKQDMLESRLKSEREASEARMKAEQDLLKKQVDAKVKEVDDARKAYEEQLEADRDHDEKLLDLRKAQIEAERKHNEALLELKGKLVESQNSDNILTTLAKDVLGKINDRVADAQDIKKLETLQAEAARRGMTMDQLTAKILSGNVVRDRKAQPAEAEPNRAGLGAVQPAENGNEGNGNGNGKPGGDVSLIDKYAPTEEFREIVNEWTSLLSNNRSPASFARAFMAWMSSRNPPVSEAASTIWMFMDSRQWDLMLAAMKPHLKKEHLDKFEADPERSSAFYEAFRAIISKWLDADVNAFLASGSAVPAEVGEGGEVEAK